MPFDRYEAFRHALARPEADIELDRAALAMVLCDYPALDIEAYLGKIDEIAAHVDRRAGEQPDVYRTLAALNTVVFGELGFRGNADDYYDPKNSFLNEVIERKLGIPISLSLLYIEIARRSGLMLTGVGFPGHFLVKFTGAGEEIVIDPFNRGEIKTRENLDEILQGLSGGRVEFRVEFLEAVSKRQFLRRMLHNLRAIYWKENNLPQLASVLDRLLIIDPDSADDIRERGLLYMKLECFGQARADLQRYIEIKPDAQDAARVREQIARLERQLAHMH